MKEVSPPPIPGKYAVTYNEAHEYTRRVPTYITPKQRERDSKIVMQIARAHDIEHNPQKVLDIFFAKARLLSNPTYWEVLRTVWIAAGSTQLVPKFLPYFRSHRGARSWFMTVEDTKALEEMDFPMTLWRAAVGKDDGGISWTRDLEWCKQYAQSKGREIIEKQFNREDIFAYISRRGEEEFIIL